MSPITVDVLSSYWSITQIEINLMILMNIIGALVLGMAVGYERSFHGRAAGMRTYGLVCMASAAITIIVGYPQYWFGGLQPLIPTADPTRVIQGVVTGIGFLGAGVIMKEGLNISGLTTAASIWASSAIGILCGAGFYFAAIMLTVISSATMIWGGYIETLLPSRHSASVLLQFPTGHVPDVLEVEALAQSLGYRIAGGSLTINRHNDHEEWNLVFVAITNSPISIPSLATGLKGCSFLSGYRVAFARN